jgi:hypothetical protein
MIHRCPTQAKSRLEWATQLTFAGHTGGADIFRGGFAFHAGTRNQVFKSASASDKVSVGGKASAPGTLAPYAIVRARGSFGQNRLDLNAPTDVLDADDDVVAFAFSPGLGDRQAQTCSLAHECEFGEVSALPVVEVGWVDSFIQ